jgi:pimeloyl-ACP methyl ester carboxylesterase
MMPKQPIPVYFMPGMAASSKIFEYIELPNTQFESYYLEWFLPLKNETIGHYALRMVAKIKHEHIVLVGVSFGGVLVQEMSKHLKVKKLIIISSIKLTSELPQKMRLAKATMAYKLLPTQLVGNIELLAKYAFGSNIAKRLELYKKYLSVTDSGYLTWAIKEMVCWKQDAYPTNLVHIHGDSDAIFPIKSISNCVRVKGGTHVMIINKYKWFNENLPKIILNNE